MLTGFATASFLAFGILLVIFGANATEIIATLRLDYAAFGLLGSMLSLGLGIGIAVTGPIVDRAPWRPVFVAACLVVIGATTTLGPETGYERLLLHMFAIGLGAGAYETVLNAMIVGTYGALAGRRLLFIHSGAAFAACAAPLLLERLRESFATSWSEAFALAGVAHVPLVLWAFALTKSRAPDAEHHPRNPTPAIAPAPPPTIGAAAGHDDRVVLAALCLATFSYVGVESALTIFVVDYVAGDLAFDAARAARTISAFWGGLFVGRIASGLVPRSPGAGTSAVLAIAGGALVFGFGLYPVGFPEIVLATVGLSLSGAFPVLIGLAGRALPSSPATAVGLAGGFGSLGGFVVPWATGEVASRTGLPDAIASLGAWLLLLAGAAALARVRRAG